MTSAEGETLDRLLDGRLRLRQPAKGHRFGTDGALLAAVALERAPRRVADLGASAGGVGLLAALVRPDAEVVLVERDPRLVALARANAAANGLSDRVRAVALDVLAPARAWGAAGLGPATFDLVLTNPPWFEPGRARSSAGKEGAHVMATADGLAGWIASALRLLAPGGELAAVHRADALPALLAALAGRAGGVRVRPVAAREGAPAIRVLLSARRGSRAPLVLLPPLALADADGRPLPDADAVQRLRAPPGLLAPPADAPQSARANEKRPPEGPLQAERGPDAASDAQAQ